MGKAIAATAGARATAGNTLRTSNLVRSARAAYETFCKLESEYPLTVLATPPLVARMLRHLGESAFDAIWSDPRARVAETCCKLKSEYMETRLDRGSSTLVP